MRGIVVLEGADGVGKSSLARALLGDFGGRYIHNRVWKNPWLWHLASVRYALRHGRNQLVVIDRLFLSEAVYGSVFRGGPAYDAAHARALDGVLRHAGAVQVLCARSDERRHLTEFAALRETRPEAFDDIKAVAHAYRALASGARPPPCFVPRDYAGELAQDGRYAYRGDVLLYDMDLWFGKRAQHTFAALVCATLDRRTGSSEEP